MNNKAPPHAPLNQTLMRALAILDAFSAERPEWGIRELGRELGINPATVLRLATTLQEAGYLERNPQTQRYSLGPTVMKLASLYTHHNPLPTLARKVFESYADRFEHNFYLGTLRHYEMVYLAALDGRGPIKVVVPPGGTTALHTTALGKILLAFQDDDYIRRFLDTMDLRAYSPRSITDPDTLWEQIRNIRRDHIAVNDGEHFDDVASVGAPLYDRSGQIIAGVSLAYPRHLVLEQRLRVDDLIPLVREISREITLRYEGVLPGQLK